MNLTDIKGIGSKKLQQLNECGIMNCLDLVFFLPLKFFHSCAGFFESGGKQFYCGRVQIGKTVLLRFNKGIRAAGILAETGQECDLVFFRQSYLKNSFKPGQVINVVGEYKAAGEGGRISLVSPKWNMQKDLSSLTGMLPQYPDAGNIKSRELEKFIRQAFEIIPEEDLKLKYVPHENVKALLFSMHFPINEQELEEARKVFLLEKMTEYFIRLKYLKKTSDREFMLDDAPDIVEKYSAKLPFVLTASQQEVLSDVISSSGTAFDVLLHGEVGSGKTVVAFLLSLVYSQNQYQTAFLSPTESLCFQTYLKFRHFFPESRCHLITRSTSREDYSRALSDARSDESVIIFGTHRILSKGFIFSRLGLVIIDEQQKFGVNQRKKLISKGISGNADVLLMSATPIPRTLALILSANYQVLQIHKHETHSPVETFVINPAKVGDLFTRVSREISQGNQGYLVCPRISGKEGNTVTKVAELVKKHHELSSFRVAILTGQQTGELKQQIYEKFQEGLTDVLIATGVIEVGIDIRNANFMIVFDANRFGLAQLHQLRGRIGRGNRRRNFFFLIPEKNNLKENTETLKILKSFTDGYKIAHQDLNRRGMGELFGIRQHGNFDVALDDLIENPELISKARAIAEQVPMDRLRPVEETLVL